MKRERPKDDFEKRAVAAFAEAVINFHDHKVFRAPLKNSVHIETRDKWNDVFLVANGLATLRDLADRELANLFSKEDGSSFLGRVPAVPWPRGRHPASRPHRVAFFSKGIFSREWTKCPKHACRAFLEKG